MEGCARLTLLTPPTEDNQQQTAEQQQDQTHEQVQVDHGKSANITVLTVTAPANQSTNEYDEDEHS